MTRQSGAQSPARQITAPQRNQGDSTAPRSLDLDALSADDVLALWARVEQAKATREVDPELREAILRRCSECGDTTLVDRILAELGQASPAAVLEAHWRELIEDRPALGSFRGAFPRRDHVVAPTGDEWLREDPRRLAGVVDEMRKFSSDLKTIVQAVLDIADGIGIDQDLADQIVRHALRSSSKAVRNAQ